MSDLLHYSAEPFSLERSRVYDNSKPNHKPRGLWLSVQGEYDWLQWCQQEGFELQALRYVTTVTLRHDANVLRITTRAGLEGFNETYRITADDHEIKNIDWARIVALYDGILIAPYQWSHRLDLMWYYTWDCASACIWNVSAIETVTRKEEGNANTNAG